MMAARTHASARRQALEYEQRLVEKAAGSEYPLAMPLIETPKATMTTENGAEADAMLITGAETNKNETVQLKFPLSTH